jgi:RNA polymerase sigma factor (sigma-70 family)
MDPARSGDVTSRERSDAELLVATASDPESFGTFYRRHVTAVLAYLVSRTGRSDVAADVCAETFARALEQRRRFDPERGPGRAWLFAIARSVLVDSFRRGQVEDRARRRLAMPARELTDEDLERIEELVDAASGPDASALVAGLPDDQREAVLARVVDERDYAEIAAELEVSEAVVRQRVSRGLSTLRRAVRR